MSGATLRVLVVDDSVLHRQTISDVLRGAEGVEIVGKAANGEEALRMVGLLAPDLITLDLEMPKMDGFTFLRIIQSRQPTPVIVISSQSQRENVFKALELGALDFVARPAPTGVDAAAFSAELLAKVNVVRALRPAVRTPIPGLSTGLGSGELAATVPEPRPATQTGSFAVVKSPRALGSQRQPRRLIVVAASTGGPQAVMDMVGRMPGSAMFAMIIAQHMPERFTRTFAERLNRRAAVPVAEGDDGSIVEAGTVWICPGGRTTEIVVDAVTGLPRLRVTIPDGSERYTPSADRLFQSAAQALGSRVTAIVLTGMGDDGAVGLSAVKAASGEVWVESSESAVVDGMPAAARRTGLADDVLPLTLIASRLSTL